MTERAGSSLRFALATGNLEEVQRLCAGDIDWAGMGYGELVPRLIESTVRINGDDDPGARKYVEEGLLLLLEKAARDGQTHVFGLVDDNNPSPFIQPIREIIRCGYTRLLAKYIEHGFNPNTFRGPFSKTAFELAERFPQHGARARDVMRSSWARRMTQQAVEQASVGQGASPPPGGSR